MACPHFLNHSGTWPLIPQEAVVIRAVEPDYPPVFHVAHGLPCRGTVKRGIEIDEFVDALRMKTSKAAQLMTCDRVTDKP